MENKFPIVRVKYFDHLETITTENIEKLPKVQIENVGWLIREDDLYYYICREITHQENFKLPIELQVIGVLKKLVTEFEVLKK